MAAGWKVNNQNPYPILPKKVEILKFERYIKESFSFWEDFNVETHALDCADDIIIIWYLGNPLGKGKYTKMKWCPKKLIELNYKAIQLTESGLKTTKLLIK
jgi:hypothetical protein